MNFFQDLVFVKPRPFRVPVSPKMFLIVSENLENIAKTLKTPGKSRNSHQRSGLTETPEHRICQIPVVFQWVVAPEQHLQVVKINFLYRNAG